MSRKYELLQIALSVVVILIAPMFDSMLVAAVLAAVVGFAGLAHVGISWQRERVARARWEEEQKEMQWALVPGPGA